MDRHRRGRLLVATGVSLAAAAAAAGPLRTAGVSVLVDPLGALGATPPGSQPAAVVGAYLVVGGVLLTTAAGDWTLRRVAATVVGAVAGAVVATTVAWLLATGSVGIGALFVGGTFGIVALGLLYGANDDEERIRIAGVGVVAVATFAAYAQFRMLLDPAVPEVPTSLLVAGHLAFDVLFAFPLYHTGLQLVDGAPPSEAADPDGSGETSREESDHPDGGAA